MEDATQKMLSELFPVQRNPNLIPGAEVKAGVYLRQSTVDGQNYESVDEQLEFIKHRLLTEQIKSVIFPQGKIVISDDLIFMDRGKTGRVGRENYHAFQNAIQRGDVGVGLVYDLSRLTRELGSLLDVYNLAQANNVELISVSESVSSHSIGARIHFIAKGMANEMQSESISRQTKRGLEVRALCGKSTGHNPYGFDSVSEDPNKIRGHHDPANKIIVINEETAKIVLRIFAFYSTNSIGVDKIAQILNDEGIPSSTGKKWIGRTIYGILKQPKYIGLWVFGRTAIKRDPSKDKLVQIGRPRNEWVVKTFEHLRIVPQDLWDRVQEKLKKVESERSQARNKSDSIWGTSRGQSNHLFTGTLVCGDCGGNFMTITGKDGGYMGCRNAYRVGSCANKRSTRTSWVEASLLKELRHWIEDPATLDMVCKDFNNRISERMTTVPRKIKEFEAELGKIEHSISHFVGFIAKGNVSDTISIELEKAEAKKNTLQDQITNLKARKPKPILITPFAIKKYLCNLDEVLKQDIAKANAHMRRLFASPIRMIPQKQTSRSYFYEAAGEVNLSRLFEYSVPVIGAPNGIRTRDLRLERATS